MAKVLVDSSGKVLMLDGKVALDDPDCGCCGCFDCNEPFDYIVETTLSGSIGGFAVSYHGVTCLDPGTAYDPDAAYWSDPPPNGQDCSASIALGGFCLHGEFDDSDACWDWAIGCDTPPLNPTRCMTGNIYRIGTQWTIFAGLIIPFGDGLCGVEGLGVPFDPLLNNYGISTGLVDVDSLCGEHTVNVTVDDLVAEFKVTLSAHVPDPE